MVPAKLEGLNWKGKDARNESEDIDPLQQQCEPPPLQPAAVEAQLWLKYSEMFTRCRACSGISEQVFPTELSHKLKHRIQCSLHFLSEFVLEAARPSEFV